jgi:hypothetical protein
MQEGGGSPASGHFVRGLAITEELLVHLEEK